MATPTRYLIVFFASIFVVPFTFQSHSTQPLPNFAYLCVTENDSTVGEGVQATRSYLITFKDISLFGWHTPRGASVVVYADTTQQKIDAAVYNVIVNPTMGGYKILELGGFSPINTEIAEDGLPCFHYEEIKNNPNLSVADQILAVKPSQILIVKLASITEEDFIDTSLRVASFQLGNLVETQVGSEATLFQPDIMSFEIVQFTENELRMAFPFLGDNQFFDEDVKTAPIISISNAGIEIEILDATDTSGRSESSVFEHYSWPYDDFVNNVRFDSVSVPGTMMGSNVEIYPKEVYQFDYDYYSHSTIKLTWDSLEERFEVGDCITPITKVEDRVIEIYRSDRPMEENSRAAWLGPGNVRKIKQIDEQTGYLYVEPSSGDVSEIVKQSWLVKPIPCP